jgi:hypothetical protein
MDETEELDDIVRPISIWSSCEDLDLSIMRHHSLIFTPSTDRIPRTIHTDTLHDWRTVFLLLTRGRSTWLRSCTDILSGWSPECYLALLVTRERLVLSSHIPLDRPLALFPVGKYSWSTALPDSIVFLFHRYYKKEIQSALLIASALTRSS